MFRNIPHPLTIETFPTILTEPVTGSQMDVEITQDLYWHNLLLVVVKIGQPFNRLHKWLEMYPMYLSEIPLQGETAHGDLWFGKITSYHVLEYKPKFIFGGVQLVPVSNLKYVEMIDAWNKKDLVLQELQLLRKLWNNKEVKDSFYERQEMTLQTRVQFLQNIDARSNEREQDDCCAKVS